MNAQVIFDGEVDAQVSFELGRLADELKKVNINVDEETTEPSPGARDGGFTLGLAITGLALSSVGTLVSVLTYWKSTLPRFSVRIARGDVTVSIENLSAKEIQAVVAKLNSKASPSDVVVKISQE